MDRAGTRRQILARYTEESTGESPSAVRAMSWAFEPTASPVHASSLLADFGLDDVPCASVTAVAAWNGS